MRVVVRWINWWMVTFSFALFVILEVAVVYIVLRKLGMIQAGGLLPLFPGM